MNKGLIKTISQIVSIILTVASSLILTLALGAVELESWSWGGFFALIGAVAWLTYVMWGYDKKNTRKESRHDE
ncbi:MAG: hypothetical protein J6V42_06170 [Clostridia bacterium]|nr:hypothetical protein [Clostridia bacterium]